MAELLADLPALSGLAWCLLVLTGLIVGVSKSAIPAVGTLAVVLGAAVIPARESTGALLVLFMTGDVLAVWTYRRDAAWGLLVRLFPMVVAGVLLGVGFLAIADDRMTAIAIGIILVFLILLGLLQRRGTASSTHASVESTRSAGTDGVSPASRRLQRVVYGTLGGFTTMVANAGGPAMSMYFLAARLEMMTFLGTAAWFFALTNLFKLPFSVGLGLITGSSLLMNAVLVPAIVAGFVFGRVVVRRIHQRVFDRMVMVATIVGAAYLVVEGLLSS